METPSLERSGQEELPVSRDLIYSEQEVHTINVRAKARGLTRLCVDCNELGICVVGRRLTQLHRKFCEPEVGPDFRHCAQCSRTLDGCAVDAAALDRELHEQLAYCTRKRGFQMPFLLTRWDVLLGH